MTTSDIDTTKLRLYKGIHVGEACAVLGNGPSILNYDLTKLKVQNIGVNRSWKLIQSYYHAVADIVHLTEYFTGAWHAEHVFSWRMPHQRFRDVRTPAKDKHVIWIRQDPPDWSVKVPNRGPWSGYSGICAIELALYMGFEPVYLLGYDMKDNQGKFYKCEHGPRSGKANKDQRKKVDAMAACIPEDRHVYNCSKDTALTCFPYRDAKEIFE